MMLQGEADEDNLKLIDDDDDEDLKAANTLRQPYRIFSDIPNDPSTITMSKLDADDDQDSNTAYVPIHLSTDSASGMQTLTMSNTSSAPGMNAGPTVLQYATAHGDGTGQQFFTIPAMSALSAGNIQYQLTSPGSSGGQSVLMTTNGTTTVKSDPHGGVSDEAKRKRELRLLKNREAALECRRKKKDYIKCLENRVALLENQNKTLIEELKSLKELYCQKDN